jgi:hypothetical protein
MKKALYILICFLWCSCAKDEEVVKTFDTDAFRKIEFKDSFEVIFHTSDEFKIVAHGTERFIEDLEVSHRGDSIVVENKVKAAWLNPQSNKVRLDIYADSLVQIRASESCNLSSADTLRSDDLLLIVSSKLNVADLNVNCRVFGYYNIFPCSGTMTFSGEADQLNIWNDALMEVDASGLSANRAHIQNRSGGDCRATINNELTYAILNRGNIFLSGNPEIIQLLDDSGEGELILVD